MFKMFKLSLVLLLLGSIPLIGLDFKAKASVHKFDALINSASQDSIPIQRGGFVTIFVSPALSGETLNFTHPWPDTTPNGAWIELSNCQTTPSEVSKKLPIVGIFNIGSGAQSQVNVYIPNHLGSESPFGSCQSGMGADNKFKAHWVDGTEVSITVSGDGIGDFPGIFTVNSTGTGTPNGFHYNATTATFTTLSNCASAPNVCPVSTGGVMNFLIVYTTGGEALSCQNGTPVRCDGIVGFGLPIFRFNSRTSPINLTVTFYGYAGFIGQEQANIPLPVGIGAGTYNLSVHDFVEGQTVRQLPVVLHAAN